MSRIAFSRLLQQVSDEGDVLYVFPKDFRTKLAAKSFRIKIEPWLDKAKVSCHCCSSSFYILPKKQSNFV